MAAAGLAGASAHPLARALHRAVPQAKTPAGVIEVPGFGLKLITARGDLRLGSRRWCGVAEDPGRGDEGPELWFAEPGARTIHFRFSDAPRSDAAEVVAALMRSGIAVEMLSGDRRETAGEVARNVGIQRFAAECAPAGKTARLQVLAASGRRAMMVGDGLNDAPALAAAHVSMSPSAAADISRNAADVVFQGAALSPVLETIGVARGAQRRPETRS